MTYSSLSSSLISLPNGIALPSNKKLKIFDEGSQRKLPCFGTSHSNVYESQVCTVLCNHKAILYGTAYRIDSSGP